MSKVGHIGVVSTANAAFDSITAGRILSFGEPSVHLDLKKLNILIGPNGTGKSNLIEVFGLLHSLPSDISDPFRIGGGIDEWMWRGAGGPSGTCELEVQIKLPSKPDLIRYALKLRAFQQRPEIVDERIEFTKPRVSEKHPYFFYQFQDGRPVINVHDEKRSLRRETLDLNQSVLKQRKDPETYPEITAIGQLFERISLYRDWSVGIDSAPRDASPIDGKADFLEEDAGNLTTVLNRMMGLPPIKEQVLSYLQRFYAPATDVRFEIQGKALVARIEEWRRFSTTTYRLSDGTLRWLCLLTILLNPDPPPLICIEEPELGIHPDAIGALAELLRIASTRTQVIATTHSDLLVTAFGDDPESIIVCDKDQDATRLRRLEKSELGVWLKDYALGDLWMKGQIGGVRF